MVNACALERVGSDRSCHGLALVELTGVCHEMTEADKDDLARQIADQT